jgi:thioredoxin reductase (NADPH)
MDIQVVKRKDIIDVAVIGAGPAGMTAALYAARSGYNTVMFERIGPGGQIADTGLVENYPGFENGIAGDELARAMFAQTKKFGVETLFEEVTAVDFTQKLKVITSAFDTCLARSVIIATGASAKKLGLPLEDNLFGKGVSYCATCDGNFFRDKTVMVVGGGNTAVHNVIYLENICKKTYLVHRQAKLSASKVYHEKLSGFDKVELVYQSVVRKLIAKEGKLAGVRIEHIPPDYPNNKKPGPFEDIACEGLFIAVGIEPSTAFLAGSLEVDERGFIVASEDSKTSIEGVFAAGDIRTKSLKQVATAIGDGATAAEAAANYLVS